MDKDWSNLGWALSFLRFGQLSQISPDVIEQPNLIGLPENTGLWPGCENYPTPTWLKFQRFIIVCLFVFLYFYILEWMHNRNELENCKFRK